MFTKGEWKVGGRTERDGELMIVSQVYKDGGFPTIAWVNKFENEQANAHLIATAVNACIKVNPENPHSVAESILDLYEACKEALEKSHNPEVEAILAEAIAKAEGTNSD